MSWIAVAVGAGVGIAGGTAKAIHDSKVSKYQGSVEAAKDRYSAFTGQHGGPVEQANPWGDIIQGAGMGAQGGAAIGNMHAGADWMNKGGSPTFAAAAGVNVGNYGQGDPSNPGSFWGVDMYPGGVGPLTKTAPSNPWGMSSAGYAPSKLGIY